MKNIFYGILIVFIFVVLALVGYALPSRNLGYPVNYFSSATNDTITLTAATSSTVLSADPGRLFAHITNEGGSIVNLSLGATAVASKGIELQSGESYEFNSSNLFVGAVYGYAVSTTSLSIVYK